MGWKSTLGGIAGGVGGFFLGGPAGAAMGYGVGSSLGGGMEEQGKADKYGRMAIDQAERDYNSRAPMRRMGMQILGQSEAPIDMGNLGYNSTNPFAAARGPTASNATRFQSNPGFSNAETDAALGMAPQAAPAYQPPQARRMGVQPLTPEPQREPYPSLRYRR